MKLILDSSAISAIFFREEKSEDVENEVRNYDDLLTIDLAYSEILNVAWKRVLFFGDNQDIIFQALRNAYQFIDNVCTVISAKNLVKDAFEIAISLKVTGYDALFLALAKREEATFLTLDSKLKNKLKNTEFDGILITL